MCVKGRGEDEKRIYTAVSGCMQLHQHALCHMGWKMYTLQDPKHILQQWEEKRVKHILQQWEERRVKHILQQREERRVKHILQQREERRVKHILQQREKRRGREVGNHSGNNLEITGKKAKKHFQNIQKNTREYPRLLCAF